MLLELVAPLFVSVLLQTTAETPESPEKHEAPITNNVACNCVSFVRSKRPDLPPLDASMFRPSTSTPFVGAVALMYYPHSGLWHVAYVEEVGSGWIRIIDANYSPCAVTRRTIHLPDRVKGYL